jgi:hypothetical protein
LSITDLVASERFVEKCWRLEVRIWRLERGRPTGGDGGVWGVACPFCLVNREGWAT